jgi:hypothetical protein
MEAITVIKTDGGEGLLAGEVTIAVELTDGDRRVRSLDLPPGAPERPPTDAELRLKVGELADLTWDSAAAELERRL